MKTIGLFILVLCSLFFFDKSQIFQNLGFSHLEYGIFGTSCIAYTHDQYSIEGVILDQNGVALTGASIHIDGTTQETKSDSTGHFSLSTRHSMPLILTISYTGYVTKSIKLNSRFPSLIIKLEKAIIHEEEVIDVSRHRIHVHDTGANVSAKSISQYADRTYPTQSFHYQPRIALQTEQYGLIKENIFLAPTQYPLSTFSVDVDRAAYANVRRFINNGQKPPEDAVRIEEMINYFEYDYPEPQGVDPLAIHQTLTQCPWNTDHQLLHIGLQAKRLETKNLPPSNLVFLIDVSGSMRAQNKLPLVKSSFQLLLQSLRPHDRVAIVTYAGNSSVLLESTPSTEKEKILKAIRSLSSGGSTGGAEGIQTAYDIAVQNFIEDGNNRIILATDGDFNVGINSPKELEQLIAKKRKSGVYLSVLGYGMGNYKDEQMQTLADKGNGNHAYIDNIQEANRVLVSEFGGTLFTLAKDVKLQIEFNPAYVENYRLIGYENRLLNPEDFNDDTKDAGEIGSGHSVTAIYEIIPIGSQSQFVSQIDDLKYQENKFVKKGKLNNEMATIKFRYKTPKSNKSKRIVNAIPPNVHSLASTDPDVQFAIAVAEFGLLLRNSDFIHTGNFDQIIDISESNKGKDKKGYKAEFVRLVRAVQGLNLVDN